MYTAIEPSPASSARSTTGPPINDIIMANTSASSTLCSNANTGSNMISTSVPNTFYQRNPLNSTHQPLHSLHHHQSNHHHHSATNQLHHPPLALSPPHSTTADPSTTVIKPSSSPTPSSRVLELTQREDDTANFVSSSSLYNLDTVQTTISPSTSTETAVTDPTLRSSNIYLQQQQQQQQHYCEDQTTPQDVGGMEINNSSSSNNIPTTLLLPPEYNNHHKQPNDTPTTMESQQLSHLNHLHHHDQYPLHTSHLHHHSNNALDIHDNIGSQKRINNNTLVSSYTNAVTNNTTAAFTPSPSSDSHCESPTTPNPPSLSAGIKGSTLLTTVNSNNDRHLGHGCEERDIMSPPAGNISTTPTYHLVNSPTTNHLLGTNMMDIGAGSNHLGITHPKTPQDGTQNPAKTDTKGGLGQFRAYDRKSARGARP